MGSNLSVNKLIVLYGQNLSYFTGAWILLSTAAPPQPTSFTANS